VGLTLTRGQSIFLDTAPLIYLFEEHDEFLPAVQQVLDEAHSNGADLVTSMVTYIEILTAPLRSGATALASRYREYLTNSEGLSIYPLNVSVGDEAARLRAEHGLRTPDAIQIATATTCGADFFLTNDRQLSRVPGIDVVLVADLAA
jgi:predicted nucleic acid-binding protein